MSEREKKKKKTFTFPGLLWVTLTWLGGDLKKMGGSKPDCNSVQGLNNCIDYCSLEDMHLSSPLLTRTNCNFGNALIESKLDRVLVNSLFFQIDLYLQGSVLNQSLSDHNPFLISEVPSSHCKTPFRYFNYWAKEAGFFSVVKES